MQESNTTVSAWLNPFMDTAHTAHLGHGGIKLSPTHGMGDASAAHSQQQYGQANSYAAMTHHAHPYAARDFLLRRDPMSGLTDPNAGSHHSMFVPSSAGLHAAAHHSEAASSHVLFPGLHDGHHSSAAAAHVNGQMRLGLPGSAAGHVRAGRRPPVQPDVHDVPAHRRPLPPPLHGGGAHEHEHGPHGPHEPAHEPAHEHGSARCGGLLPLHAASDKAGALLYVDRF